MDKIRRQKDLITRTVDKFKQTTSVDYARYFEGSPTYVTYYQLDDIATRQDTNLENVHSLVGRSSPNKYKKIHDVVIYGVDAITIQNDITEKGLQSLISGDFVLLPDSIRPYPGDFFVFDEADLGTHLFRINDVQYDRASPKKFFRCLFSLWPENSELIFGNVIEDFVLDYQTTSGENFAVIKKADAVVSDKIKLMVDSIIDRYRTLFYDEDMDTFVCNTEEGNLWLPYLQRFMSENDLMTKYEEGFMEEIYIGKLDQSISPTLFSDQAYHDSIFTRVQKQLPLTFKNTFLSYDVVFDLKKTRNLPFFHSSLEFKTLLVHKDDFSFPYSFHFLFQKLSDAFKDYPSELKFLENDEVNIDELDVGTIFYEVRPNTTPSNVYRIELVNNSKVAKSISFGENLDISGELIYNIISKYLVTDEQSPRYLVITEAILTEINNMFIDGSIKNYVLLPILIYILKEKVKSYK
jgi:hypothetical protein